MIFYALKNSLPPLFNDLLMQQSISPRERGTQPSPVITGSRSLPLEAVIPVPLQEVGVRAIRGSSWLARSTIFVDQRANARQIVNLPRNQDFEIIGETD
jgi:hypothetical protein